MKLTTGLATAALLFLIFFSCTMQIVGNGSEITNGTAATAAGPADTALVVAYPQNYNPVNGSTAALKKRLLIKTALSQSALATARGTCLCMTAPTRSARSCR
jgi:hypothetical protein